MSWPKVDFLEAYRDVSSGHHKFKSDEYAPRGKLAIVDQGLEHIAGYTDDVSKQARVSKSVVIFGDHTRHVKYIDHPFAVGADGVKIFEAQDGFDVRFLFHFLLYLKIPSAGYSRHYKYLKQRKVPLPPLEEQRRIAAILDQADHIRRLRQKALDRLNQLPQAIFHEMFEGHRDTGELIPITEIAEPQVGFAFKSKEFSEDPGDVRLCRGANVLPETLDWSDVRYWPKIDTENYERFLLKQNDVIIAMDRPWIKGGFKRALVNASDLPTLLVQRVMRLRAHDLADSGLVYCAISSKEFEKHCRPTETTVPHISPVEIKEFCVPRLSSTERSNFADFFVVWQRRLSDYKGLKTTAQTLFASLQQRAFRGGL